MSGTGYHWVRDRWRVRAVEWVLYALAWSFRAATAPVPAHRMGRAMAPVGRLAVRLVPGLRRRTGENLARVWPEMPAPERARLAREAGAEFARLAAEYAQLDRWARQVRIETEGAHNLPATGGVVLVTAHYGNWEAIRLAARALGRDCGIIYRPFNNRYLDRYALAHIGELGRPVLHKGKTGMRALRAHLAGGGAALILVDQRNSGAPFLPFLGHPAETVTVAASLARATGATLLPAVARRSPDGRSAAVRFEAPVPSADPEAAMTEVNARIGAWIAEAPAQWFWFHRRWRATRRSRARP